MSIPVINVQKFPDEVEYKKLREACEKWGCFRMVKHEIPLKLMEEMKMVVRSLLELPMDIKKCNVAVIQGSGYVPPTPSNPLYEALGLYDLASPLALHHFFSQLHVLPHHRKIIEAYVEAIHEVAINIAQRIAECVGVNVVIHDLKDWPCELKLNKYNFTPHTVGSSGVQLHTDSGLLTILQDDEHVGGLQVMDASSPSFVPVQPLKGTLFANLGDVAHAWSNGRFCNVKHGVQCKEGRSRVSIATFLLAPREGKVEAVQELVDCDHPRLFRPFAYQHYRNLRLSRNMRLGEALHLLRFHLSNQHALSNH